MEAEVIFSLLTAFFAMLWIIKLNVAIRDLQTGMWSQEMKLDRLHHKQAVCCELKEKVDMLERAIDSKGPPR